MNNHNRTSTIVTTCAVGMAVGTAAYMMAGNRKKVKMLKKNTGKALRNVNNFIDNVSYMMR